jgi:hypothetical protein
VTAGAGARPRRVSETLRADGRLAVVAGAAAHYQKLRAGRNGAICGEVNGKNRMGAYTGFKTFVIPRDRSTAYISEAAGGFTTELYSAFTTAYIGSCANQQEARLYDILTAPSVSPPASDATPVGNEI